ncbi:ATP-binding protein [Streptomyces sp. NPDC057253]|uniref:ATP-binding protein n=1 Tax=Streptomyces sp. NPDC057253 TaxID=3346069 RepID=UPI0036288E04
MASRPPAAPDRADRIPPRRPRALPDRVQQCGVGGRFAGRRTGRRHRARLGAWPSPRPPSARSPDGHAGRIWDGRIRELIRPGLLILDDFAIRQLSASQADEVYELVCERQGRYLIMTSNRVPSDWYPMFLIPVVAALLDWLVNSSQQVIMNGPSYRPNKRPKGPTEKPGTPSNG